MDGAGWHKSKTLVVPENIRIVYLPPYSLALNLVERLWQHIKSNTIRNQIYESLQSIEDKICQYLTTLTAQTLLSLCSYSYLYN